MSLLRTKSVEQSIRDTDEPEHRLKKDLTALDLTVFGIGVIIGTGIFVLTGTAAKNAAGPAVALSFVIAGIVCALAALCYAEFASTVPVAGSAYTFSYATLGELPAWIIGWDLALELALGAAVVSVGWSNYFNKMLEMLGVHLPATFTSSPSAGGYVNLPAIGITLVMTLLLVLGVKMSSRVNLVIVTLKVAIVLFVIFMGLRFVDAKNYVPFIPEAVEGQVTATGGDAPLIQVIFGLTPVTYGLFGVFTAAALVFFAYIGFDVVATAAEETKNPQRDLPRGIIGSLAICTALYVAVSLVVVGMVHYTKMDTKAPLASAFDAVGHPGYAQIISIGGLAGLTTVVMILLLGQARVLFAMSRDNLLPLGFARVHPKYGTPSRIQITVGVFTAVLAGFIDLEELGEMVNIGTLFAFVMVSISVIILRRTRPDLPRKFRTPLVPYVPIAAALASFYLMLNLPLETWYRFAIWMAIGFGVYFLYSRSHSKLASRTDS